MFSKESLESGLAFRNSFVLNRIKSISLFEQALQGRNLELTKIIELDKINSRAYNEGVMNLCSYLFTQRNSLKEAVLKRKTLEERILENINKVSKDIKRINEEIKFSKEGIEKLTSFEVAEEFNKVFKYIPGTTIKNNRSRNCEVTKGLIKSSNRKSETLIPELVEVDLKESSKGRVITEVESVKVKDEFFEYRVEEKEYLKEGAVLVIKGSYNTRDYVSEILIEDFSTYECAVEKIFINEVELSEDDYIRIDYGNVHLIYFKNEISVENYRIRFRQLKAEATSFENRDLYTDSLTYKRLERYPYSHKSMYVYRFCFKTIELRKRSLNNLSCIEFKEKIHLKKDKFSLSVKELCGVDYSAKAYMEILYMEDTEIIERKRISFDIGDEVDIKIDKYYSSTIATLMLVLRTEKIRQGKQYLISKVEISYV